MPDTTNKKKWNQYWRENVNKSVFFNTLVALARKYYFAKAFAKFIAGHYDVKGKTICEIGVGSGLTLSYLKKMGAAQCVGIDYSPEAIKFSSEQIKDCEFIIGDAFNLGRFGEKKFDLVYSLGFLEHYNKNEQKKLISEQKRLAKECVFIEVPYDIFYFRWLFALNKFFGRTLTFSDEEMFTPKTFQNLGLKGKSIPMRRTFYLTIGYFENVCEK
ncbi:class I SAM-dependent methyltransferase [Patescibacteria group bacterium]|nr:class I SAM-dependent methyltransferase [Candidatus Falkowbacteria bacterium]MBU3906173.1 class I SAM-dependent methyltransferase [Patescibacteria group bacterium]MCG2697497.1 class I SAM-dependent methyltransferase [Candidatus Parcubacteria bacterium]MBU4014993.1 class I SAM-dependent methyltransferase [Patescibacteria group bacterium]MBU4026666.1 class I SAM-dependent methyltransferase [Patescibacteria group bacterium]